MKSLISIATIMYILLPRKRMSQILNTSGHVAITEWIPIIFPGVLIAIILISIHHLIYMSSKFRKLLDEKGGSRTLLLICGIIMTSTMFYAHNGPYFTRSDTLGVIVSDILLGLFLFFTFLLIFTKAKEGKFSYRFW